jgi:(1->4)-alpha-D-glucan 1-alpha-D-glucosylmutase
MREAKTHTDWLDPNEEHERAVEVFVRTELRPGTPSWRVLEDLLPDLAWHGALASLAQVVLKVASPGVPDVYRGTELWDLTLVDPDNRRPYDRDLRAQLLGELRTLDDPAPLFATWPDGRVKFLVLLRTLAARTERPDVFVGGDYFGFDVAGARAAHLVAFARRSGDDLAVAIAPRRTAAFSGRGSPPVSEIWADTRIALPDGGDLTDAITGRPLELHDGSVRAADALATFPVALLTSWR